MSASGGKAAIQKRKFLGEMLNVHFFRKRLFKFLEFKQIEGLQMATSSHCSARPLIQNDSDFLNNGLVLSGLSKICDAAHTPDIFLVVKYYCLFTFRVIPVRSWIPVIEIWQPGHP